METTKNIIKKIYSRNAKWKTRKIISSCLYAIAAAIIIGGIIIITLYSKDVWMSIGLIFVSCCFSCIPFFIAQGILRVGRYRASYPYSDMHNGTLVLGEGCLEYSYWTSPKGHYNDPARYESKDIAYEDCDKWVYSIEKNNILSIEINEDICLIKGNGSLVVPWWATEGSHTIFDGDQIILNEESEITNCIEFRFLMAFKGFEINNILNWRKNNE